MDKNDWQASAKSKKHLRNCMAYELSRAGGNVIFRFHFSKLHVFRIPEAEWEALPNG
ncbi:hypothetical protein [Xanthomonas phage BUDD]|nr:hypothetical protein [Xanthomonas phage BUDD]